MNSLELASSKIFKRSKESLAIIILHIGIILIGGCVPHTQYTKPSDKENSLFRFRKCIDQILQDSLLHQTQTGIKIVSLETGETLYSRDSHQLFHPASNVKLLTTAVALKRLGPNYKFKTALYTVKDSLSGSILNGDLYLKGFGDPDLVTNDLQYMISQLKLQGITRIEGDLICDDTYFDDLYYGSGWMWDDASTWEFAPISALSVDDNCVRVTVKPGLEIGDSITIRLEPHTSYMKIINKGITVDPLDSLKQKSFKVKRNWKDHENSIIVKGGLSINSPAHSYIIDVIDAQMYAGSLFIELLSQENIFFQGKIRKGRIPDTAALLVEHFSSPLSAIVMNTNKNTDNLSAELTLKVMGAELKGQPGTAKKGISVIYEYLKKIGIDSNSCKISDGSGVSRYNLITPNLIIELLKDMHNDTNLQVVFKASLPIAGIDGTLKNRMVESPARKKLFAKTGKLSGVSALSGYTTTLDGEPVAFSILMEHFLHTNSKINDIQDKIGELISSFSRRQGRR